MDICLILYLLHTCCFLLHTWWDMRAVSASQLQAGRLCLDKAGGTGGSPSPKGGCQTLCLQHFTRAAAVAHPEATAAPLNWGLSQTASLKITWSSKPKDLGWSRWGAGRKLELHGQGRFVSKLFSWAVTQRSSCCMFNTADVAVFFLRQMRNTKMSRSYLPSTSTQKRLQKVCLTGCSTCRWWGLKQEN